VLRRTLARVHRICGRGLFESVETSEELAVSLMTCERCGVLAAEWVVVEPRARPGTLCGARDPRVGL
jgi:hypothetical protein